MESCIVTKGAELPGEDAFDMIEQVESAFDARRPGLRWRGPETVPRTGSGRII